MEMTERYIFKMFPKLKQNLPWMKLADLPTPVTRLENLGKVVGNSSIWLKRDDLNSKLYSGNKPRKFEFIFAEAKSKGAKKIVTTGSDGSNHGVATALFGKMMGFDVCIATSPQPVLSYVRDNIKCVNYTGAKIIHSRTTPGATLDSILEILVSRVKGERAYWMYFGGSSLVGNIGFVEAGLEIAAQIHDGLLPEPEYIFTPSGSCGTHAGLSLGLKYAGLKSKVIGVRIVPKIVTNKYVVTNLFNRTARFLEIRCSDIPHFRIQPREVMLLNNFFGGEYGRPTHEGKAAIKLLNETEGVILDPTYTGKAFAGMLDFIRQNKIENSPILYWNTLNTVPIPMSEQTDLLSFPPELRRYFTEELYDPEL